MKKLFISVSMLTFIGCYKPFICEGPSGTSTCVDGTLHYEAPEGDGLGWVLSTGQGQQYAVKTPPEIYRKENIEVHACIIQTKDSVCGWGCYPQYEITSISKQ